MKTLRPKSSFARGQTEYPLLDCG